jgi:phosphoribosylaminoimidazole-succinocarboxamide synthase
MLDSDSIRKAIPLALNTLDVPGLGPKRQGKVREWYAWGDWRVLITTDRLSAFDRILGQIPYKGQVLNQLAAFWFERTRDIVANHLLAVPDPNVTIARECTPYPVEVVVRGYITGVTTTSLWYHYERGIRELYGVRLPEGLRKNDALPTPLITPTTKATSGHDERLTAAEVVSQGYVPADEWSAIERAALAVFARGQELARAAGLVLVDTKYEFGRTPDGAIALIDEVHTPDSSRFWRGDTYAARLAGGQEPDNFDKEFIRLWYAARGYRGDGEPPAMPEDLIVQASERYIAVYEQLTGTTFVPAPYPAGPRIAHALSAWAATEASA